MPKTPPPGDGWEKFFESTDQRVWKRINPETGEPEEHVELLNPNAVEARLEDLEGRVGDLEGGQ